MLAARLMISPTPLIAGFVGGKSRDEWLFFSFRPPLMVVISGKDGLDLLGGSKSARDESAITPVGIAASFSAVQIEV